jgi:hypothetical protein
MRERVLKFVHRWTSREEGRFSVVVDTDGWNSKGKEWRGLGG